MIEELFSFLRTVYSHLGDGVEQVPGARITSLGIVFVLRTDCGWPSARCSGYSSVLFGGTRSIPNLPEFVNIRSVFGSIGAQFIFSPQPLFAEMKLVTECYTYVE